MKPDGIREVLDPWTPESLEQVLRVRYVPQVLARLQAVTRALLERLPQATRRSGMLSVARSLLKGAPELAFMFVRDPALARWIHAVEEVITHDENTARLETLLTLIPRFQLALALIEQRDLDCTLYLGRGGRARIPVDGRVLQGPAGRPIRIRVDAGTLTVHTKAARQAGPFELADGDATGGRIPAVEPLSGGALFQPYRTLGQAVNLLSETAPAALGEAGVLAPVLFAVRSQDSVSHSAALSRARGAIWLSIPERPLVVAETLIHESSHLLFHLVEDWEAMAIAEDPPRLTVPWRADLRPARAVLMGVHAWVRIVRWLDALASTSHAEWASQRLPFIEQALGQARDIPRVMDTLTDAGQEAWELLFDWYAGR